MWYSTNIPIAETGLAEVGFTSMNSGVTLSGVVSNIEEISLLEEEEVRISREERGKGESKHFDNLDRLFEWLDSE